uniref:Uncharacterized protein n=1 Tax=Syphacia muris TaxID=451379 RepID=A0A0N5AXX4_9BILA
MEVSSANKHIIREEAKGNDLRAVMQQNCLNTTDLPFIDGTKSVLSVDTSSFRLWLLEFTSGDSGSVVESFHPVQENNDNAKKESCSKQSEYKLSVENFTNETMSKSQLPLGIPLHTEDSANTETNKQLALNRIAYKLRQNLSDKWYFRLKHILLGTIG